MLPKIVISQGENVGTTEDTRICLVHLSAYTNAGSALHQQREIRVTQAHWIHENNEPAEACSLPRWSNHLDIRDVGHWDNFKGIELMPRKLH